jgi:signal transduction histidine kinase
MAHPNVSDRVESVRLAEEQAALRRVATLAARESSPPEVFEAVAEEAARVLEVDAIGLLRFEPDETATLVAQSETPWDPPPLGTRFTLEGENIIASVHRTGQAARMDDWESATGSVAAMANVLGVRSTVASPIVVEGRLWGTMIAATNQDKPLPADTESRIVEFTELLATSIANAESREALSRLATEQAALRRVATLVAQDVRPSEIFAAVAQEVADLFHTTGSVLRFEEGGQAAVIVGIAKVDIPLGVRMEFEEGMGPIEVYRTGRSVRVDHTSVDHSKWSSDEGSVVAAAGHLGLVSSVVSPIVVEGKTWGVIGVSSTDDPLPPATEERLEKFTDLVATAIANAQSREALAGLAAEQAALRRVATLVAGQAAPDEIYAAVAEEVARLLLADRGAVVRYESGDTLTVTAYWSTDGTDVPVGTRIPLEGDVVTATVRQSGRPIRINTFDGLSGPLVDHARTVGPEPRSSIGAPIFVEGLAWGTIFIASMKTDFPDGAESRVLLFTELLATAIANAENRSELAASRKRLVAASDEARRRIERDLHDGTQQRLVSLALAAHAAAADLPTESDDVREKFWRIATGLGEAVEDLQELSRGIHPAILSDAGLRPALETLALRSPIPVELEILTQERFPEPIEIAAYFVASESLANAAKHSQASRITILLAFENERLRLTVRDDGIGGADSGRGSGLVGLRDRVEALGGTLAIDSVSGAGTSLSATLPVGDDPGDPTT